MTNNRSLSPLRKLRHPERNLVIGGGMDHWQRGTTFANTNDYTVDRFIAIKSHSAVVQVDQDTDLPEGAIGTYSCKYSVTTGAASTTTSYGAFQHRIESYLIRHLAGKYITVSFWYKSNVTGKHTFSLIEPSPQQYRYTHEFDINQADTWTQVRHTLQLSPSANYGNGIDDIGMQLSFNPSIGSDYHGAVDSWVTNGDFGSSTQVDLLTTTGNYFKISDVMIHEGSENIPFSRAGINLSNELLLCQRYYYTVGGGDRAHVCYVQTTTLAYATVPCPVDMRATPTFGSPTHNISTATLGDIRDVGNVSRIYNTSLYTITASRVSSNLLALTFNRTGASTFTNLGPAVMRVASSVLLSFDAEL